jgi:hypothetical protein
MLAGQILKEIYFLTFIFFVKIFIIAWVTLFVTYIARLSIRYVNDGDYKVNYFFTKKNKLINFLTKSLTKDTDDVPGAILLGMILIPLVCFMLIMAWPITFTALVIFVSLKLLRHVVRFQKKVNKHIEHL